MVIHITLIRPVREPYEIRYYQECDKNERLEMQIIRLEEERDLAQEDALCWKNLYLKKPLYEKADDVESIVCAMSRLQYLLDEIEDIT